MMDDKEEDVIHCLWTYGSRGRINEVTKELPKGAEIIGIKTAMKDNKIVRIGFKIWMPKHHIL